MSQSRMSLTRYGGPQANYHQSTSQLFAGNQYQVIKPIDTLPTLLLDFKKLYDQTQDPTNCLYDVILEVESNRALSGSRHNSNSFRVLAQKQLLIARSGFFENLVFGDESVSTDHPDFSLEYAEDNKPRVVFKSEFCHDIELLRDIVKYMYWGYWAPDPSRISRTVSTFILAAQLDLKELRNHASTVLSKNLDHKNVVGYLFLADKHEGKLLKQKCIEYIIDNRIQVQADLEKMVEKNPESERDENYERASKLVGEIYKKDVISRKQSTQA